MRDFDSFPRNPEFSDGSQDADYGQLPAFGLYMSLRHLVSTGGWRLPAFNNEIDLAGPEGLDAMKVDNIRPQKVDSPYTTRSTWLAQKALSSMKVVTPRLDWIPLSPTLGHGVGVLASGRLPYPGTGAA